MNQKNRGFIGCGLLAVGVFSPIVSMPIVGSMNYFHNGQGDGIFILILAAISLVLVLKEQYKSLIWTGLASATVLTYTFFNFQMKMDEMKASMEEELAGNPFRGLADMAVASVQLQWGWAVLVAGAGMLIWASLPETKSTELAE